PDFGVEALAGLFGESAVDPKAPVFASRMGGWMALGNMRRNLRDALKADESFVWVTPYSFRRTVATVVRDAHGLEAAQQQLSHAKLSTTEAHYVQRVTQAPDHSAALSKFVSGK
ncbi:MAG: site-specific integrase, partial [Nocardiaceae bacterium]|nr:site-specific integrase [Nocardiaceae bacterium]